MNETIAQDLVRHFTRQLNQIVVDQLDTCNRAELDRDSRAMIVVSVLASTLVRVTYLANGDEEGLHELIQMYYRTMREWKDHGEAAANG
jgi:hypothetical protein